MQKEQQQKTTFHIKLRQESLGLKRWGQGDSVYAVQEQLSLESDKEGTRRVSGSIFAAVMMKVSFFVFL